jgi:hypothetical protein
MLQLSSAAEVTGLDVLTNVVRHLWPPVVASDQFEGLESTWVAGNVGVMVLLDNPLVKLTVLRDINLSSKHQQTFHL